MKKDVARNYLEVSIESSSPLRLVVILYDITIEALKGASDAVTAGDTERRTQQVNRAMTALGELQGALDFETGGEVATQLAQLYTYSRRKLYEAHANASGEGLEQLREELISIREAWKQVERSIGEASTKKPGAGRSAPSSETADGFGRDWSA